MKVKVNKLYRAPRLDSYAVFVAVVRLKSVCCLGVVHFAKARLGLEIVKYNTSIACKLKIDLYHPEFFMLDFML